MESYPHCTPVIDSRSMSLYDMPRTVIEESSQVESRPASFAELVKAHRRRLSLSQNELARRAAIDPAYINRMEHPRDHLQVIPSRRVVEAIVGALSLDEADGDRLLVAASYCPASVLEVGSWDQTMVTVIDVLRDPDLTAQDRSEFRQVIQVLASRWRRPR